MGYAEERDAFGRTPQSILTLGLPRCENFYAQTRKQHLTYTEDLTNAIWTLIGGATRIGSIFASPRNGEVSGIRLTTPANGDGIEEISSEAAASRAFTFSIFLSSTSFGILTVHLEIADGGAELVSTQVSTSAVGWSRLAIEKKFTAGAVGNVRVRVKAITGDSVIGIAGFLLWGANLTENLGALDQVVTLPYVKRVNEADTTLSTMASRCQATDAGDGARCTYAGPGCQDLANYNPGNNWSYPTNRKLPLDSLGDPENGIREYKFCKKQAPLPIKGAIIRPLLTSHDESSQEIDGLRAAHEENTGFITRNEVTTYRLEDDALPGNFDLEKSSVGALTNTGDGSGSFWRRFLAIHPNFDNPAAYGRLATGFLFSGVAESDFHLRLSGPIASIKISPRGIATVEVRDELHITKRKIPAAISATNQLVGPIDAITTTINVDDPSEFSDPAPNASEAEIYTTFDGSRSSGPDWVVVLQMGNEKMTLLSKTAGGNPLNVLRGRWGTTAIAHADNSTITEIREFGTEQTVPGNPVLPANPIDIKLALYREAGLPWGRLNIAGTHSMLEVRSIWVISTIDPVFGVTGGFLFRRTLTEPTEIDQLLKELDRDIGSYQFIDEDRMVNTRFFGPPTPSDTLVELTDVSSFIDDPGVEVEQDNEARLSRVAVGWNLIPGQPGDVLGDFAGQELYVDPETENPAFNASIRDQIILSRWITDAGRAQATASRNVTRLRNGAKIMTGSLEAKDDDNVKLGGFVYVTTAKIQKPDGSTDGKRIMLVVRKERDPGGGRMRIRFLDTAMFGRFWFWSGAADALPVYDSATDIQRRFGFWAGANGRIAALNSEPYRWQ